MRRITFKARYHEMAWAGQKRATVRVGSVRVEPGERVVLACGRRTPLVAVVERVCRTQPRFLTTADAMRDGFTTLDELHDALEEIYPGLEPDALLSIITFRPDWAATRQQTQEDTREHARDRGDAAPAASPAP